MDRNFSSAGGSIAGIDFIASGCPEFCVEPSRPDELSGEAKAILNKYKTYIFYWIGLDHLWLTNNVSSLCHDLHS